MYKHFSAVLYTLAKHGRALGAYKLTKQIHDRLQTMHLPSKMRDEVDLSSITLNSGPMIDSEVCWYFQKCTYQVCDC